MRANSRTWLLGAAAAGALLACQKQPTPTVKPASPGVPVAATTGEKPPAAQAPFVLTPDKLERYLTYQRTMVTSYAKLIADVKRLEVKADAGVFSGISGGLHAVHESLALLDAQRKAQEQARAEVELEESDISAMQEMVGAVVARRKYASLVNLDGSIAQLSAMRDKLPAEQRAQLDESLKGLQDQKAQAENLSMEREKYGNANVDLMLSREKDLVANYDAWLQALGNSSAGKESPRSP